MISKSDVENYLIHSYLYYILYQSVITDYEFDALCVRLLHDYPTLNHQYKYLFNEDDLRAGTGHQIKEEDYPDDIRQVALALSVNYD